MNTELNSDARRRGFAIPVIIAGALSSVLLAFSMTPTFSALAASIQNTVNTAGSGTLIMQETDSTGLILCNSTDGGSVSTNSATCATINSYGGNMAMVPGQTVTTALTIKNTGTVTASAFTLAGGTCTQSSNGSANGSANDLCSKINLVIKSGSTTLFTGTAQAFATQNLNINSLLASAGVLPAATVPFSFAVTLDSSAGNTYQGLKVTQPMTFTFGA